MQFLRLLQKNIRKILVKMGNVLLQLIYKLVKYKVSWLQKSVIDFVMAPNGRYALVQYNLIQSDGSVKRKWTSFDLFQTKEERTWKS